MNETKEKVDGYDLPVYGKGDNTFFAIHVPALVCISISFCCVVTVFILSFKRQSVRKFWRWSKMERFVIYLAVCDGGYNICHWADHMNYAVLQDHVEPKSLCVFYAFMLYLFIMSQILMVNVIAVNAFMLMYKNKNLNLGRYDWRILCWAYGVPFLVAMISSIADWMGPNGAFCFFDGVKGSLAQFLAITVPLINIIRINIVNCFFDGVKGGMAQLIAITVPLVIIILMNIVMYALTWHKIKRDTARMRHTLKESCKRTGSRIRKSTSEQAAKIWSMFVVAFFIQWWSLALLGVWLYAAGDVPQVVHHFVTTLTNLGGVLNLLCYTFMRYRMRSDRRRNHAPTTTETDTEKSQNATSLEDSGRGTDEVEMSESVET